MALFEFLDNAGDYVLDSLGLSNEKKTQVVRKQLDKHDLGKTVVATVQDNEVTLSGEVETQEELEKVILATGNGKGVSQVGTVIEVVQHNNLEGPPEPTFYTVERGDNLSKIAKQFYGSANKYPQIFEANKPMLTHPDKIYPGQKLRIPLLD